MNIKQKNGYSLVEMLVVVIIVAVVMNAMMVSFMAGQNSWTKTNNSIQLKENLRRTIQRIAKELRESGSDQNNALKVAISYGQGVSNPAGLYAGGTFNTDILDFAMPITCQSDTVLLDSSGNVKNWGAPLTWGCTDSSCMDPGNSCAVSNQRKVEYKIDANHNLLRRVIEGNGAQVNQTTIAEQLVDFQVGCPEIDQVTFSDLAMVNGSTTLTSATGGFTAAMGTNHCIINITSGTNFIPGCYEIKTYSNANTVTFYKTATKSGNASAGKATVGGKALVTLHVTAQDDDVIVEECMDINLRNHQ
ncbi:MAG: prepilin-type N-terminal cleavage/methylation domain-containing protein [Candidatus Omnitrophica bacterium]|nr:prepilin-type N-terminal cleavage/methylation domain-containing protein [Candidatus Omnitrophota bacterium]